MKTRKSFTIALAAAAALGCGASAWAQQENYPSPDGRYEDGYQRPYDQTPYDNGGYAGPRSVRRLLIAAHEIDDAANYIHRQYDRNNRRPDRREARVSARLAELAGSAREFHREVAGYRGDSRHTQDDFQRLVRAYDRATDALGRVAERPYVDQGMERIATRLDQTATIYGLNLAEMTRYHGERRYDRDRRDRDDSYRGGDNGYDNGYRQDRDGDVYVPSPPPPPPHR
jgi:hypothetical protein